MSQSMTTGSIIQNLRTGNMLIDLLVGLLLANFMSKIPSLVEKLSEMTHNFFKKQSKRIEIFIEANCNNEDGYTNNKILIEAILYYGKGYKYKLSNRKIENVENDLIESLPYHVELARKIRATCNEEFIDDDIFIVYELVKKKKVSKNLDGKEVEELVNDRVIMTLSSYNKTKDQILDYVQKQRNRYIEETFIKEYKKYIFIPLRYDFSVYLEYSICLLNHKKTFDTLFIPDKQKILKLIDNFHNKTGIYSMDIVQNKMGILLHGLPGCGKTSFIKALANHLDRHVILIHLDKNLNKSCLNDLFFGHILTEHCDKLKFNIPNSKKIIVFEEIDTTKDIVLDRDATIDNKKIKPAVKKPKINLGDLLNLFDGIRELDGLIYVMTTNHKEVLDPALIRPGRINLDIELGNMKYSEIVELLTYCYISHEFREPECSVDYLRKTRLSTIETIARKIDGLYTPSILESDCCINSFENFVLHYSEPVSETSSDSPSDSDL